MWLRRKLLAAFLLTSGFALTAVGGLAMPTNAQGNTGLLVVQVNEALRQAEIMVTPAHQLAWAHCVVFGHINCTSFERLVDSMKWHAAEFAAGNRSTPTPDASKFIKAVEQTVARVTSPIGKVTGTVSSYRATQPCSISTKTGTITLELASDRFLTFRIPCEIYEDNNIQVGSSVLVKYSGTGPVRTAIAIVNAAKESGLSNDSGECTDCAVDTEEFFERPSP